MALRTPAFLVAAGHAHPERELTSAALEAAVPGLSEGWSEKYLGMHSRRALNVEDRATDLAITSVNVALEWAEWAPDDLDAVVYGATLVDQVAPASASYVARATNPTAVAYDVNASCAGFLYALSSAIGLLATQDQIRRAAICVGEHATAYADYTDRTSSVFWGDSGAAILLSTEPDPRGSFAVVDLILNGNHEHPEKVFVPRGGYFRSDGRYSYATVLGLCVDASRQLIERNGIDPSAVKALVMHQANERVLQDLSRTLDIPWDRQWHNFEWAGNQGPAGVATAFSAGWNAARTSLQPGDTVLLTAAGGGYAGGAALLEWRR